MPRRNLFKAAGITPTTKCVYCDMTASDIVKKFDYLEGSKYSKKLGGWVCYLCIEANENNPNGTVVLYIPGERCVKKFVVMGHEDRVKVVNDVDTPEVDFETTDENKDDPPYLKWMQDDSPIQFRWYSRSYALSVSYEPKAEGWVQVYSDIIKAFSEDERQLATFDTEARKLLWARGIDFARAFGTIFAFMTNYDILVRKEDAEDAKKFLSLIPRFNEYKTNRLKLR